MNRVVLLASLVATSAFAQNVELKPGAVEVKSKGKTTKITRTGVAVEATKKPAAAETKPESADEVAWEVTGAAETLVHECKPGEAISVSGASNTLTLTGSCGAILVSGASNTVVIDEAAAIEATGAANKISWTRGPKGAKPSISSTGISNTISQRK